MYGIFRLDSIILAKPAHVFDAAPPRFHVASPKKRVCDFGVVLFRTMPLHQCFGGPIGRENAIVAYKDFVLVYANLNRDSRGVIRMHQGVVNGFAHGILWNGVAFHPDQAVVTDACLEILEVNELDDSIRLNEQRTVNFILVLQIGPIAKKAYFHVCATKPFFRLAVKKQDCGSGQFSIYNQIQAIKQFFVRHRQILRSHPARLFRLPAEDVETLLVQIPKADSIDRDRVPFCSGLVQQKLRERSTLQKLLCAPGPVMIFAFIVYGICTRRNRDFDVFLGIYRKQVYIYQQAQCIPDFIRDIFHELLGILQSDDMSLVIYAYKNLSTLSIRKTAYPLDILISPRFLVLDVLTFGHIVP